MGEGAINLGLAKGLVSPGLFICAGGVLYDSSQTRVISFYRGVTQVIEKKRINLCPEAIKVNLVLPLLFNLCLRK